MKNKKNIILISCILAIAAVLSVFSFALAKKPAVLVKVSLDGKVIETLDLNRDHDEEIISASGGTNHLRIQDGQVWMEDASCPDKICIHQGKIHQAGEMIVCLPNQLLVKITDQK